MSYAIRKDKQGMRSIDYQNDVLDGEYYSENPIEIIPLPLTNKELEVSALTERDRLLSVAAIRIAPLQDAYDLGTATDDEIKSLKEWKQYRISLNGISEISGFPNVLQWPESPW